MLYNPDLFWDPYKAHNRTEWVKRGIFVLNLVVNKDSNGLNIHSLLNFHLCLRLHT
jgi:hypothetical protein